jgi:hypothetical protein
MDQKSRIKFEESLSLNILDRSSTSLNGEFLHSQLLIDVLLRMKPNEKDKRDLIALCKNEYENKDVFKKDVYGFGVGRGCGFEENSCSHPPIPTPTPSSYLFL